ncbi:MAG: hypothetical protein GXP17_07120 [Gammaproteobacteria bacterium]|nr:hypothetical protein [Gammaproteobacteria bacterium]
MNDRANKKNSGADDKKNEKKDGKKKGRPVVPPPQTPKKPSDGETVSEPTVAKGDVKPEGTVDSRPAHKKPPPKKNPGPTTSGPTTQPERKTPWTAIFSLIIGLGALGVAGFAMYLLDNEFRPHVENQALQLGQQGERLKQQGDHLKQQDGQLKQQGAELAQLQQSQQAAAQTLADEVSARQTAQAEHQALSVAMNTLSEKLGRTTLAWRLAEVEYLLTVANHRLTLAQDIGTAVAVFETADGRLKALGDPALLAVRNMISQEVISLRSLPQPDIAGMALEIGNLALQVNELPLIDKARIAAAVSGDHNLGDVPNWRDIPQAMWKDLKSLVTVRRHQQQPIEPLLPPSETWFLQQNLRLKLEQARLALLRTDTPLFRQYLTEAKTWVTTYFDAESAAVANLQNSLSRLGGEELSPVIPDVSGSLKALRQRLGGQEWSTTGSAPPSLGMSPSTQSQSAAS